MRRLSTSRSLLTMGTTISRVSELPLGRRLLPWCLTAIIAAALCAGTSLVSAQPKLSFIGAQVFPTGASFDGHEIGGLSGLAVANSKVYAVSDDRDKKGGAKVFIFNLALATTGKLKLKPEKVVILRTSRKGGPLRDVEGIIKTQTGFLAITEGDRRPQPPISPRLLSFDDSGLKIAEHQLPRHVQLSRGRGIRDNLGLESLAAIRPDGRSPGDDTAGENIADVMVGTENALLQDGEIPSFMSGSPVRLLRYRKRKGKLSVVDEFAYPVSPTPLKMGLTTSAPSNTGLVELLHIRGGSYLALERTFVGKPFYRNVIRLFHFDLPLGLPLDLRGGSGTRLDISKVVSLRSPEGQAAIIAKTLVYDFDLVVDQIPGKRLDNFEAMAWGPRWRGQPTLIFCSDNNFNPKQKTIFLAFSFHHQKPQ